MDIAERFSRVAGRFDEVARAVPADRWNRPAPCEGWTARDVVAHLVEWVPPFVRDGAGFEIAAGAAPGASGPDLVAEWDKLRTALQARLDDPAAASAQFAHPQAGTHRFDDAIAMFVLGDVLVHTWDLAVATGQPAHFDEGEARDMLAGVEPHDEMLRSSGHYGPRVAAPAGADVQTRLLAFLGRRVDEWATDPSRKDAS